LFSTLISQHCDQGVFLGNWKAFGPHNILGAPVILSFYFVITFAFDTRSICFEPFTLLAHTQILFFTHVFGVRNYFCVFIMLSRLLFGAHSLCFGAFTRLMRTQIYVVYINILLHTYICMALYIALYFAFMSIGMLLTGPHIIYFVLY